MAPVERGLRADSNVDAKNMERASGPMTVVGRCCDVIRDTLVLRPRHTGAEFLWNRRRTRVPGALL